MFQSPMMPNPEKVKAERAKALMPGDDNIFSSIAKSFMPKVEQPDISPPELLTPGAMGNTVAQYMASAMPASLETLSKWKGLIGEKFGMPRLMGGTGGDIEKLGAQHAAGNPDFFEYATGYPKRDWMLANLSGAANVMMPGGSPMMNQIDVYHGSPHKFDKFKMSQIGTGEGRQVFGHGLYFTDKPSIAEHYANTLFDEKDIPSFRIKTNAGDLDLDPDFVEDAWRAQANGSDIEPIINKEIDRLEKQKEYAPKGMYESRIEDIKVFSDRYNQYKIKFEPEFNAPQVYKATLHKGKEPWEYDYLDWDKPVSAANILKKVKSVNPEETSVYRELVRVHGEKTAQEFKAAIKKRQTDAIKWLAEHEEDKRLKGNELYKGIAGVMGSQRDASDFLLRAGIDGIRYPAGTLSGGTKEGAKNYVVFDESAITIQTPAVELSDALGLKYLGPGDGTAEKGELHYFNYGNATIAVFDKDLSREALEQKIKEVEGYADKVPGKKTLKNIESEWKAKGVDLELFETKQGDIKLDHIAVPKDARKKGTGTKAVEAVTDYADSVGKRVVLTVAVKDDRFGTTSRSRLVKFYKRFGFVENKGRNKDFAITAGMYRDPVTGEKPPNP